MKKMNLSKNFKFGFTLIELLVVVAIIGLLASVVLASLNSARAKGADAAVKSNLITVRNQAELYYNDASAGAGKYTNTGADFTNNAGAGMICPNPTPPGMFNEANIQAALKQVVAQMASTSIMRCSGVANGQKWAISVVLKGEGITWCIDNNGWSKQGTISPAGVCS